MFPHGSGTLTATNFVALLILTMLWSGCSSQPQSRNQRLAVDIQNDGFNTGWSNRQSCLEESNFSLSVLTARLAQQPPGTNDAAWAAPRLPARRPWQ
jgi:hypothetical protein